MQRAVLEPSAISSVCYLIVFESVAWKLQWILPVREMKLKFATNNAQLNLKRWLKLSRASSAPELDSLDQAYFQKIVHSVIVPKTSFEGLEWLRFQCLAPSYMHMAGLQPGSYRYASDMWTSGPMCDHISSRTGTRRPAWLISAIVHIPLHANIRDTIARKARMHTVCPLTSQVFQSNVGFISYIHGFVKKLTECYHFYRMWFL